MNHYLPTALTLLPTLAIAHGKHPETASDTTHGLLHAAISVEGAVALAALGAVAYLMFIKK